MEFKYKNGSYVKYEGDRYLVLDMKLEGTKKVYRLMGLFDWVEEKELTKA